MEFFGFMRKKQELQNSPEMQANARARTDQAERARITREVAADDLAAIRRDAAE